MAIITITFLFLIACCMLLMRICLAIAGINIIAALEGALLSRSSSVLTWFKVLIPWPFDELTSPLNVAFIRSILYSCCSLVIFSFTSGHTLV